MYLNEHSTMKKFLEKNPNYIDEYKNIGGSNRQIYFKKTTQN